MAAGLDRSIELHTLHLDSPVQASDGMVHEYLDGIGMLICESSKHACRTLWFAHFTTNLVSAGFPWPVGTGASGATILGMLGRGTLFRSPDKTYGLDFYGPSIRGKKVVLVDDIAVTGRTLEYLHHMCDIRGAKVVGEVLCVDRRSK